ncbi:Ig-like domain repeat protein [Tumebacillus sp. ITR2]|uniref:Ig-like domain repeat protein n=1 Tax=Tumebacillus amylolyticus TaxID=2801339 RepID=A0ABS1J6P3_9BACL|nr:FlgD immunoglobulin-like domain containing protein [Tumebacillus amylolyticus]MBL0385938.1 Ig-like domain repeat protein [Tumebacillus amylolyticus]
MQGRPSNKARLKALTLGVAVATSGWLAVAPMAYPVAVYAATSPADTSTIGLTLTSVATTPFAATGSNTTPISYSLKTAANVTLVVLDADGNIVRTVLNNVSTTAGSKSTTWNGKNDAGQLVTDGVYTYKLSAADAAGTTATPQTNLITIDRTAPVISGNSVDQSLFAPTGTNHVNLSYSLSETAKVTVNIYNSSNTLVKTLASNVQQSVGTNTLTWDGKNSSNVLSPDGVYTYKISAVDLAGLNAVAVSGTTTIERSAPSITAVSDTPDPFKVTGTTNSTINYTLSEAANVSLKIYDKNNLLVRTLVDARLPIGTKSVTWNGKNDSGVLVDDGLYTYKINATDSYGNQATEVTGTITTDKTAPTVSSLNVGDAFAPGQSTLPISYELSENAKVTTTVSNAAGTVVRTLESSVAKQAGLNSLAWDGKNTSGVLVPDGTYTVKVNATDAVGFTSPVTSGTTKTETGAPVLTAVKDSTDPFKVTGTSTSTISYTISEDSNVSVKIYGADGRLVRTLVNGLVTYGAKSVTWNGKSEAGDLVVDGTYTYKINATDLTGKAGVEAIGTITTDNTTPNVMLLTVGATYVPGSQLLPISYVLSESAKVTTTITNSAGTVVRTLESAVSKTAGDNNVTWDGKNASGVLVPDGTYTVKITATDAVGFTSVPVTATTQAESGAAQITAVKVSSNPFKVTGTATTTLSYTLSEDANVDVQLCDANGWIVRTLTTGPQTFGAKSFAWNGKNDAGFIVADGTYTIKTQATDRAGNVSTEVLGTITTDSAAPVVTPTDTQQVIFVPGSENAVIGYSLSENSKVTTALYNSSGTLLKTLESNAAKSAGANTVTWDGKNSSGVLVPDGLYTAKLTATDTVGWVANPTSILFRADRGPASVTNVYMHPFKFTQENAQLDYTVGEEANVNVEIFDASGMLVKTVFQGHVSAGKQVAQWTGRDESSQFVPDGIYTYKINVTDMAGHVSPEVTGTFEAVNRAPQITNVSAEPAAINRQSTSTITYTLSQDANVELDILNASGSLLQRLMNAVPTTAGVHTVKWDGKNPSTGTPFVDGTYTYVLTATTSDGWTSESAKGTIQLDNVFPSFRYQFEQHFTPLVRPTPVSFTLEESVNSLKVYITDKHTVQVIRTIYAGGPHAAGTYSFNWDGLDDNGNLVPDELYSIMLEGTDLAGNRSATGSSIFVENHAPILSNLTFDQVPYHLNSNVPLKITCNNSGYGHLEAQIYNPDGTLNARLIDHDDPDIPFEFQSKDRVFSWYGVNASGVTGTYKVVIQATNWSGMTSELTSTFEVN